MTMLVTDTTMIMTTDTTTMHTGSFVGQAVPDVFVDYHVPPSLQPVSTQQPDFIGTWSRAKALATTGFPAC